MLEAHANSPIEQVDREPLPAQEVVIHPSKLQMLLSEADPELLAAVLNTDPPPTLRDFTSQNNVTKWDKEFPILRDLVLLIQQYLESAKYNPVCGAIMSCHIFPNEAEAFTERANRWRKLVRRDEHGRLQYDHRAIAHGHDTFWDIIGILPAQEVITRITLWHNQWAEAAQNCAETLPVWQREFFSSLDEANIPTSSQPDDFTQKRSISFRSPFDDKPKKRRLATYSDYAEGAEMNVYFDPYLSNIDHKGTFFHEWTHQHVAQRGSRFIVNAEGRLTGIRNGFHVGSHNMWLNETVTEYITRCTLHQRRLSPADAVTQEPQRSYHNYMRILATLVDQFGLDTELLISAYSGTASQSNQKDFSRLSAWFSDHLQLHLVEFAHMVEIIGPKTTAQYLEDIMQSDIAHIKSEVSPSNDTTVRDLDKMFESTFGNSSQTAIGNRLRRIWNRAIDQLPSHYNCHSREEFEQLSVYRHLQDVKLTLNEIGVKLSPSERFLLFCFQKKEEYVD